MRLNLFPCLASALLVTGAVLPVVATPASAANLTVASLASATRPTATAPVASNARRSRNPYRGSGRRDFVRILSNELALTQALA